MPRGTTVQDPSVQDDTTQPEGEATQPTPEDKPKVTRLRAEDYTEAAYQLIVDAGDAGILMSDITEALGIPHRTTSNVTWHLEGQPEPHASSEDFGKLRSPEKRRVHRMPGSRVRYQVGAGENVPAPTKKAAARLASAAKAATSQPAE